MNRYGRKNVYQQMIGLLLFCIMAGSKMPVYATEELQGAEQTISYIYHRHIGNSTEEGGCYGMPVYHCHMGDETAGGACYETPVYHSHTGNDTEGGACYETALYHAHEGDGTKEEGCYVAVYHVHNSNCYATISSSDYGCEIVKYWDTNEGDYEGHDYKYYEMSCGRTIHGTNSSHTHTALSCSRGGEITGYGLNCGLTEESIMGFSLSCEKTAETIDSYMLSCSKTAEDIDGYERNCGKEEDIAYGAIVITKQTIDTVGAMAFVEIEDYTEGELQLSDNPFCWYDEQGNIIGTGDSISVSTNGTYKVRADMINEDIRGESLWAQIDVDNIREQSSSKQEDEEEKTGGGDSSHSDTSLWETIPTPLPTPTIAPTPTPTPAPTKTSAPTATPSAVSTLQKDGNNSGQNDNSSGEQDISLQTDEGAAYRLEKKEVEGKAEEKKSNVEPLPEPKEIKKQTFFTSPAAKVLMLTAGTLFTLTGLFLVCYLFRRSVRIYGDDGQGNMTYLGRCMVQLTEDGYLVALSRQITEKAVTNRYCIKPGLFAIGRGIEELLVEKQEKRISIPLQKEMIVVI